MCRVHITQTYNLYINYTSYNRMWPSWYETTAPATPKSVARFIPRLGCGVNHLKLPEVRNKCPT